MTTNAGEIHNHFNRTAATENRLRDIDPLKTIQFLEFTNNLPYSFIARISGDHETYYYLLEDGGKRIFYRSTIGNIIPSFSAPVGKYKLTIWGVHRGAVVTQPLSKIIVVQEKQMGGYDLDIQFSKKEDIEYFKQVNPLIEKHYGKSALPSVTKVEEASYDMYSPERDTIFLSPTRHNFIHELLHASRKQFLFASKNYQFFEECEVIEEFFAEGVANAIKDELNDFEQTGLVYGSTMGYNFDFRNGDPAFSTTCLQSTQGGIVNLELHRYYVSSEAFAKISMESPDYAKKFNELYYRLGGRPNFQPSKWLFYLLTSYLVQSVEGVPTRQWLDNTRLFDCAVTMGDKVFMSVQDYYTHSEYIAIAQFYHYETFENASDWAFGDKRYDKNGDKMNISINGDTYVFKIPEYENGFGNVKLYLTDRVESKTVDFFVNQDKKNGIESYKVTIESGLQEIEVSAGDASTTYLRLLGEPMHDYKDSIIICSNTLPCGARIKATWTDGKRTMVFPPKYLSNGFCEISNMLSVDQNFQKGKLTIEVDGKTYYRNLGYGGEFGGHQILL